MKARMIICCLTALFSLTTANAQGVYPRGGWQSEDEEAANFCECTIYAKKRAGNSNSYHKLVCNGELTITDNEGNQQVYVLIYDGKKQANGHVFTAQQRKGKSVVNGKIAIRQYGDERKTIPTATITAITANLKGKPIDGQKLRMLPTNGMGID